MLPNSHCEPCNIDHTWHGKIAMMFKDNNKHAKISPPNLLPEISFWRKIINVICTQARNLN